MPEKIRWYTALLADKELSLSAKSVAGRIMLHHNERTGQCNPSHKRLALGLGLSEKHGRKHVCKLVSELRAGGWIEATETDGSCEYRLQLDRATTLAEGPAGEEGVADQRQGVPPVGDRGCPQSATGGVPDQRQGVSPIGDTEPPKEPSRETTKGTTKPNPAPAAVAIEPEVIGPAKVQTVMPDKPKADPPTPANDDTARLGVVRISGLEIPGEMYAEWEATFRDIDLRPAIISRAKWAAGLGEKRPGHRLRALQTELGKMNEKARQERLTRQENRQADKEAKVERDEYGRIIRRVKGGWIEKPLALPPGENPRLWVPPVRGTETVFAGKGWSLTQAKLEEGLARWPAIDFKAAVTEFDAKHASREVSENENRTKLVDFLDARQAEAMAA